MPHCLYGDCGMLEAQVKLSGSLFLPWTKGIRGRTTALAIAVGQSVASGTPQGNTESLADIMLSHGWGSCSVVQSQEPCPVKSGAGSS